MGDPIGAELTVSGQILIPGATPAFHGATAHVSLERLRGEDAPAETMVETVVADVRHESGTTDSMVPFKLHVASAEIESKYDYALRAWIDLDGNGKPEHGDMYSDERHSLLIDRLERIITVRVVKH